MPEKTDSLDDPSEKKASFHSETVKGIVILFYKNLLLPSNRQYTVACSLCRALAKRMKETQYLEELEKISMETRIGYPLGLIQTIVFRDMMFGSSTNKTYNYGWRTRPVKLGDMILALDLSLDRILDIFTEICVKHDIDTTFATPLIEGLNMDRGGL